MIQKTRMVELNVDGQTLQKSSAWHVIVAMITVQSIAESNALSSLILVSTHYAKPDNYLSKIIQLKYYK